MKKRYEFNNHCVNAVSGIVLESDYFQEDIGTNGVIYLFILTVVNDGVIGLVTDIKDNNKVYIKKEAISS